MLYMSWVSIQFRIVTSVCKVYLLIGRSLYKRQQKIRTSITETLTCSEIWGFQGGEDSSRILLDCDAASCCGTIPVFQRPMLLQNYTALQARKPRLELILLKTTNSLPNINLKWPRRNIGHSHPSSNKVKNAWSYISNPPICFCGVDIKKDTRLHGMVLC